MKLTHLGISHFRSIGETPVMIDLNKKITVLVGQNDCGKSNVLRGVGFACQLGRGTPRTKLTGLDNHNRDQANIPQLRLVAEAWSGETNASAFNPFIFDGPLSATEFIDEVQCPEFMNLNFDMLNSVRGMIGKGPLTSERTPEQHSSTLHDSLIDVVEYIRSRIAPFLFIPQFRRIENEENYSIGGQGVIKLLSLWQHPEIGSDQNQHRFQRVEKLLRELLGRPRINIEVPHTQKEILVRDGNLRLPLESHGTGIHQLIILAIAVLSEDNALFGIEEPEIHLHPVLQRRFLKFLREETGNNRYIITTHSQTMIAPSEDVDVIHLKMVDGVTIPTRVTTNAHALEALDDLGVRASDLLQANAVIWVEGPSDRIYLKHWMALVSRELGGPELIEGIDYAMMFYGGRLLSHLSLEREGEIDDGFIQLLRINQRSAIVMDSDRKESLNEPLNATKQRVIAECESNRLHAWVTDGREIENYLSQRTVEAAAKEASINLDDRFKLTAATSKFDDAFKQMVGSKAPASCNYAANKVPWAHRFVKHIEPQDISATLKDQVKALLHFIRPNA